LHPRAALEQPALEPPVMPINPTPQIILRKEARAQGLKRYFTGKSCKWGHISERLVSSGECITCNQLRQVSDAGKATAKRYRQGPKRLAAQRRYYKTPHGQIAKKRGIKKFRQSPKGKISTTFHINLRRARLLAAEGTFTVEQLQKLLDTQKKCHICGKRFTKKDPATLDHVIPISNGGRHEASNIALAHKSCNSRKRDKRTHLI
jgi:5-methylcytosine-specific restriction endonuclease McrA